MNNISIFHGSRDWIIELINELRSRGFNVLENSLVDNTDICFVMGLSPVERFLEQYEKINPSCKIIGNVFDIPYWRLKDKNYSTTYLYYRGFLLNCDDVVTISKTTSKQIKDLWDIDSKPIMGFFNERILNKYMTPRGKQKRIVSISRFTFYKSFETILEAVKNSGWKVTFIGYGEEKEKYEKLARENNVDLEILENIPKEQLVKVLRTATVCVQPSIFEGFSIVPKEALWCDVPVLLADIPINRECHENTVMYFPPRNAEALKVLLEESLWLPADIGRNHIMKYTVEAATNTIEEYIRGLQ